MGRKRKYNSETERKTARARHDATYYEKNKRAISKKAALKYDTKVKERMNDPEHRPVVRKNTRRPEKSSWGLNQSRIVERQVTLLHELTGASMRTFGEDLYLAAMEAHELAADQLNVKLSEIREIEEVATQACDAVWEAEGATNDWRHMKVLLEPFHQVIRIVTQLWDLTVSDVFHTQDLENAREHGKLIYQTI